MAIEKADQFKIVTLLGWPIKTLIEGSTHYSKYISDKFTGLDEDSEGIILALLDRINAIDTKLTTSFSKDNIRRVDDIEFTGDNMTKMRSERTKLLCELSDMTDIENKKSCGVSVRARV